jgi:molybdenum cofactor cytidylyltransferase
LKSVKSTDRPAILIVAAGKSSRLGKPKQLIPWQNTTLLGHAINCAKHVSNSRLVVLGANFGAIRPTISTEQVVEFPNWEKGMGAGISFGLRHLLDSDPTLESVLITVCDQPYVTTDLLQDIIRAHKQGNNQITACEYGGSFGVPALFSKSLFPDLLSLDGDRGAKSIIVKYQKNLNRVKFPEGVVDIDQPEDLQKLVP